MKRIFGAVLCLIELSSHWVAKDCPSKLKTTTFCLTALLLIGGIIASAETVTVRSGNGPVGGDDSAVTFLLGPPSGPFNHAFTSADFASAQSGPAAFILSQTPYWISGLSSDPSAHWIGTDPSAGFSQGNTALYAVSFQITSAFTSATLALYYAEDDAIGDTVVNNGPNTGVYLNGSAVCGGAFAVGFSEQHSANCGDVSSLLHVGTNWLYIEDTNAVVSAAGLVFSATIGTTEIGTSTVTVRSGNGPVGGVDSAVTFLVGPPTGDFGQAFTTSDFLNAQNGPAAFILSGPASGWITGLSADPSAKWIGANATAWGNAENPGTTALYAISFPISSAFTAATLALHYSVDDGLGTVNPGIYLNGTPICGNSLPQGFTQQNAAICDITTSASLGSNWLYFDDVNAIVSPAGLLFSATITTTVGSQLEISGFGNSAAYSAGTPVAPGGIATAKGNFLLASPSIAPSGQPWPTNLGGLSMDLGGAKAPLYYVSATQVNFQVPWELAGSTEGPLTATVGGRTSPAQTVAVPLFSPGLFSMNSEGSGQGAILDSEYRLIDSSNAASVGDVIQIYCTGLGAATNQPASGSPAPFNPLAETTTSPAVFIGGNSAHVLYSGLAPGSVGLYQINAQVPAGITTGTDVPVAMSIGGITSNAVAVAIQPFPPPQNPLPSIAALSPASYAAGGSPLTLTITGSGFISSSSVLFNWVPHASSFYNSGELSISLGVSDLASAGNYSVLVTNPPPGGGTSNAVSFSVTPSLEVTSLAGAWQGTWSASLGAKGTLTANFSQSGTAISGSISFANWCFSSGALSGTISGNQVNLTLTFGAGQKVSFNGATNLQGAALTGQYTVLNGSCVDGSAGGLSLGR